MMPTKLQKAARRGAFSRTVPTRRLTKPIVPLSHCGVADVCEGLPISRLVDFQKESKLTWDSLQRVLQLPPRTLARRKITGRLTVAESDRLCRLARLFEQAVGLFEGNATTASIWMQEPCRGLGYKRPVDLAETEVGAREVGFMIGRLEYGVYS